MLRKVLMLATLVLVMSTCGLQASLIHSRWIGGEKGEWGNAANWSPNIVPDNTNMQTFAVTIDSNSINADDINVTLQQNRTIDCLDTNGTVELSSWPLPMVMLTIKDPIKGLTNYGSLNFDDELYVTANITNNGKLEVEPHSEVNGNITNYASMMIDGGVEFYGNLTNNTAANALLRGAGEELLVKGNLSNAPGGSIEIVGDVGLRTGNIENAGFVYLNFASNLWTLDEFEISEKSNYLTLSAAALVFSTT